MLLWIGTILLVAGVLLLSVSGSARKIVETKLSATWKELMVLLLGVLVAALLTIYADRHGQSANASTIENLGFWIAIASGVYMFGLAAIAGRRRNRRE